MVRSVLFVFNKLCVGVLGLYGWLLRLQIFKTYVFSVPIVSVGNIIMGGTGKTPFVFYLAKLLTQYNIKHVVVSRGYKKTSTGTCVVHDGTNRLVSSPDLSGDEPFMLACKLKTTPIIVDTKKVRAITYAIGRFKPQIILIDDGFQSNYIKKDLDVVLFNTLTTKESLNFFPFGKLRDGVGSLKNADVVVFTKHNLGGKKSPGVASVLPIIKKRGVPYIYSETLSSIVQYSVLSVQPCGWSKPQTIKTISREHKLFSFCGIGDPVSFQHTTRPHQKQIIKHTAFQDHYNYHQNEASLLKSLQLAFTKLHLTGVLTTQKDFVKIKGLSRKFLGWCHHVNLSFFVIDVEIKIVEEDFMIKQIKNLVL